MLDERPDEFDERNLFLHGLLGLVSAVKKLDAAVAPASSVQREAVDLEDPWLHCVLGLIAFRLRAMDHLERVELPPPAASVTRPRSSLGARELLR